jgi:hypothetical protein
LLLEKPPLLTVSYRVVKIRLGKSGIRGAAQTSFVSSMHFEQSLNG